MREMAGALTILVALAGCGGGGGSSGSSSGPSAIPTPPPPFSAIDGVTGQALTEATVSPSRPIPGQSVTVILSGYLAREQRWRGEPIALWPARNEEERETFRELVYGFESGPLVRWADLNLDASLEIVGEEWADQIPAIRAGVETAFAEVAAAGGPVISWVDGSSSGLETVGGAEFSVIIDRWNECIDDFFGGCGRRWRDGATLSHAELIFASPEEVSDRKIRTHLMGFLMGLNDTNQHRAAMNPRWRPRGDYFHDLEKTAIRMMYQHRQPGNAYPDRDPAFASAATGGSVETRALPRSGR